MVAARIWSSGMPTSPDSKIRNISGVHCQTSAMMTAIMAGISDDSQAIVNGLPDDDRQNRIDRAVGLEEHDRTCNPATAGTIIIGISMIVWKMRLPGNSSMKRKARPADEEFERHGDADDQEGAAQGLPESDIREDLDVIAAPVPELIASHQLPPRVGVQEVRLM